MTKYKQNKAIAAEMVARGVFTYAKVPRIAHYHAVHYGKLGVKGLELALFTENLDSCALFEQTLSADEWRKYLIERALLAQVCGADFMMFGLDEIARMEKQTPAQRCEGFLRMLNKWEGE